MKRELLFTSGTLRVSVDVAARIAKTLRPSLRGMPLRTDATFTFYREDAHVMRRYVGTRIVVDRDLADGTAVWPDDIEAVPFCP